MRKLIVYLENADLTQLSWILINDQGAAEQITLHSQLSELAALATSQALPVTVIAAPEDVLIISAKMPKLNRQRLLQALPFAIEEQLLAEIDDLHFAIGDYTPEGLPVAIITKARLRYWLDILKENGLQPSAILPAPLTLPLQEQQWQVSIFADTAIARTGKFSGFACDKHNLAVLLELKFAEQGATPPTAINIINYAPDTFAQATQHAPEKDFLLALANVDEKNTLNLLQGAFQPKRTATYSRKIWIWTAWLAIAWIAVVLTGNLISLTVLRHQNNNLQTAINTIYKHNFPAATSVVSPKSRMTEKLNNLTNDNHKNRLLVWLAYLAKSDAQLKALKLKQLEFRNNQLSLEFTAPSFASIDSLSQALTQQGLQVKQQNVSAVGAGASGTLLISDGG
jgi:general secretion pathway protein L